MKRRLTNFQVIFESGWAGQIPTFGEFNFNRQEVHELAKKSASSLFTCVKVELANFVASSLFPCYYNMNSPKITESVSSRSK